jgi:hypothetical protein
MITAFPPAGIGAPVAIGQAQPTGSSGGVGWPADDGGTSCRVVGASTLAPATSEVWTAKPSMAALSNRGNGMVARTGSASTRPAVCGRGSVTAGRILVAARINATTPSTDASGSPSLADGARAAAPLLPGCVASAWAGCGVPK